MSATANDRHPQQSGNKNQPGSADNDIHTRSRYLEPDPLEPEEPELPDPIPLEEPEEPDEPIPLEELEPGEPLAPEL